MDTSPLELAAMAAAEGGLAPYGVTCASDIAALLWRLQEDSAPLNLNAPSGQVYTTVLWAVDAVSGRLGFAVDARDPQLQAVLDADAVTVVGYLESIKIQFEVDQLALVSGPHASVLTTTYPRQLYRFQRRNSIRVRPILGETPLARLNHPATPDRQLALRVLDIGVGGCALLLPEDAPKLGPGTSIREACIELDPAARLQTTLNLHHVSAIHRDSRALRLGCEMTRLSQEARQTLQHYIDRTQQRRLCATPYGRPELALRQPVRPACS